MEVQDNNLGDMFWWIDTVVSGLNNPCRWIGTCVSTGSARVNDCCQGLKTPFVAVVARCALAPPKP